MHKYRPYASRSNECAYLARAGVPAVPAQDVYLATEVDAARAADEQRIAELEASQRQWQPIETAPRDRYIAAWCPARRMSFQVIYREDRNGWCVIGDRYPFPEEFTHWQEMPKFDESFVATHAAREER